MPETGAEPLHRLIYLSSSAGEMSHGKLGSILEASRRNNTAAGVTGLLLYHDGCFFQALEGPQSGVQRIFARIRNDRCHTGAIVLLDSPCAGRAFADWSMGFVGSHQLSSDQRDTLIDLSTLLDADARPAYSHVAHVTRQIDTFLDTFREFALT